MANSLPIALHEQAPAETASTIFTHTRASGSGALFEVLGRVLRPDPAIVFPSLVEARVGDLLLGSVWLVAALALVVLGAATAHDGSRNG